MERQASSTECWHDDVEAANAELRAAEAELERAKQRILAAERAVGVARRLKILIVGFGNFGQFMAKTFIRLGHHVIGQSRGDYAAEAAAIGASYTRDINQALEHDPHVVIFCTSVLSTAKVLEKFPKEALGGRLVVDVLSVKEYPKTLLLAEMPPSADILCTHPMFGPQSGKDGWQNLPFVYEKVRISSPRGAVVCTEFLRIWSDAGCRMVEMTCEEHDCHAAASQFITHTTGRILAELAPQTTPINTKGYESLLQLVANTTGDSFDLYCGLFYYNSFSKAQLEKLEDGLKRVKESLFAFEAEQMKEDGGPQVKWVLSTSGSNPDFSDKAGASQS
jgi:arogenate dehydrogenase (NADP+)